MQAEHGDLERNYGNDMKKVIIGIIVLIIVALAYWIGVPLFTDKKVSEELDFSAEEAQPVLVLRGLFQGFDRIHTGGGNVSVLKVGEKYIIRFEENFNVANGPALVVGFGKDGEYIKGSDIAELKGNIGSQNYEVPANININDYNEVWIWCKAFSVGFAKAKLTPSI